MNQSRRSTTLFNLSYLQSPLLDQQANGHNYVIPDDLQDLSLEQMETNWTESDPMKIPVDDASWLYLEKFLNLPEDDISPDV